MEIFLQILCVLEVVFINLSLFSMNTSRIYSWKKTIIILTVATILIIPLGLVIIKSIGMYGNGNGLFTLFGFVYLLPFRYLFKGSTKDHFFVICFCWVYSLLVLSISIHIGFALIDFGKELVLVIVETVLFLCSYKYIKKFVKEIYIPLSLCDNKKISYYLNETSFVWFVTILVLNVQFVFSEIHIFKLLTLGILAFNILQHYQLIFEILKQGTKIGSLKSQVTKDVLTGIGNRLAFTNEFTERVKANLDFCLIYCDLDNFKSINDSYGHLKGDNYLKKFASHLVNIVDLENVFRISGDEFACFVSKGKLDETLMKLSEISFEGDVLFLGASYGVASYPEEGQEVRTLFDVADYKMYLEKQKKR